MLVDILDAVGGRFRDWQAMQERILRRASRYAAIEERLIAPDGSYPIVGRSIAYRYGAFPASRPRWRWSIACPKASPPQRHAVPWTR